jgi:VWFA-related protein
MRVTRVATVTRVAKVAGVITLVTLVTLITLVTFAQEPLPRFRSGANLVTVDAYFSKDGKPVTDLRADELEILEDNRPQSLENFRMVSPVGHGSMRSKPDPSSVSEMRSAAADPESRLFVVFFDTWHVSSDGSLKAGPPLSEFLNRVVGANDLVGVMTPDMPARTLTLTRRTDGIERAVRDTTTWGQRDRIDTIDPREREIDLCYPDGDIRRPQFRGVAKEMIERRREQKTLRALDELVEHLGTLRDERKFVVLLSEGWVLFRQNDRLAAILEPDSIPSAPPIGGRGGRASGGTVKPEAYDRGFASCERERSMLAFVDHSVELRQLAQRANRANVTFYAVDPRGLAAFDDSIGPMRPALPEQDRARLAARQGGLRELAGNTDGTVVLNTNDVRGGVTRIMGDLGSYYLMQYYSTNTKLDGRFRSITVRVKRPGVQVRARPGYLGPTEAEARARGVSVTGAALPAGVAPIARRTAVTALRRGPSTGLKYVRADEPRFRRTERIRIEVAIPAGAANGAGRVLTTQQQPTALVVSYSTEQANGQTIGIGEVILAPLAVGEYVLELSYDVNGQKEAATYNFRIIP